MNFTLARKAPQEQTFFERLAFGVDETELLNDPAVQPALLKGRLRAKGSALRTATILSWLNWPLMAGVLLVSFLHIAEVLMLIVPTGTPSFGLDKGWYNHAAIANTALIDATAFYLVAVGVSASFVGKKAGGMRWYYLALTTLLNSSFYLAHTPAVSAQFEPYRVYLLWGIVIQLGLLIGVSIYALEKARRTIEHIRLPLLAEVTVYETKLKALTKEPDAELVEARQETEAAAQRAAILELDRAALRKRLDRLAEILGCDVPSLENYAEATTRDREVIERLEDQLDELRSRPVVEPVQVVEEAWTLDALLKYLGTTREAARSMMKEYRVTDASTALSFLHSSLPGSLSRETFGQLFNELMAEPAEAPVVAAAQTVAEVPPIVHTCDVCHKNGLTATEKGIAGRSKWQKAFKGKYACRECRDRFVRGE